MKIHIRKEVAADYEAILRLTYAAFQTLDYPGRRRMDEHYFISLLRNSPLVIPELCFVAEYEGEIVGHILYAKTGFHRPDGSVAPTITFAPLSVLPKYHKQGIGRALVQHSLAAARELDWGAVLITGVPDYYPRLGFARAAAYGLCYVGGSSFDAFMAYELIPGYLVGGGIHDIYPPEYDLAEQDDAGYEVFHRAYMAKNFPNSLTLCPLFEADIERVERWLAAPHAQPWFEHPEEWLREIHERRGAFRFVSHWIAEWEGQPIGFCQYYDCFYSKDLEDWGIEISTPGAIYSIDYLIGEPSFLRRGCGTAMIRELLEKLRVLGAKRVIVQPDENNIASNRSLQACGFSDRGNYYERCL